MPSRHSTGFWHRLLSLVGADPEPASPPAPPLFKLRPVPPPEPKGPGLPPLEDILTEPPPITERMLRSLDPPEPPPPPPPEDDDAAEDDGDAMRRPPLIVSATPAASSPGRSAAALGWAVLDLIGGERPLPVPAPALAEPPANGIVVPSGAPGRLLRGAMLSLDADGLVQAEETRTSAGADAADSGELALALRLPAGPPQAFVEAALALYALQRGAAAHLRVARIYVGRQDWAAAASGALPPQLLAVLFPGARVIGAFDGALPEACLLLLDAGLRNPATDTLIGGFMPHVVRRTVEARQRVFSAFTLPTTAEPPLQTGRRLQALFLHSAPPRALAEPVRDQLVAMLRRTYDVRYVDVAGLPWPRQVRLACGADLIVGAHSPAMAAVLWGHPQARVLEFFPEGSRRYDGQLLAEAAGLAYLGLEGVTERGFVIRARERWGPPVGDTNRLVHALPWTMLEQALRARPAAPVTPPASA